MIVAKEIPAGRYDDWRSLLNHIDRFGENDTIDGCCFDFGGGWEKEPPPSCLMDVSSLSKFYKDTKGEMK